MRDLEFTTSTKLELIYDIAAGIMAVIAVLVIMIEFSYSLTAKEAYYIHIIDNMIYCVFAADYFIRLIFSKNKKMFLKYNIVDFIAILPFGLFSSFEYGRILKLIRVGTYLLRLIDNIKEVVFTNNFIYALGTTVIITIAGSIGIYFLEVRSNGNINTYGDALWWSIVTVSTVGYGDIAIVTSFGRIVACILMITGMGFLGMLTSTMSSFFFNKHTRSLLEGESKADEHNFLDISKLSDEDKKKIISYYNYLCFKENI